MKILTHPVRLRYVNLKSKMANTKLCNYSKTGIMFPWSIDICFMHTTKFDHKRPIVYLSLNPVIWCSFQTQITTSHFEVIPWSNGINIHVTLPSTNRMIPPSLFHWYWLFISSKHVNFHFLGYPYEWGSLVPTWEISAFISFKTMVYVTVSTNRHPNTIVAIYPCLCVWRGILTVACYIDRFHYFGKIYVACR